LSKEEVPLLIDNCQSRRTHLFRIQFALRATVPLPFDAVHDAGLVTQM